MELPRPLIGSRAVLLAAGLLSNPAMAAPAPSPGAGPPAGSPSTRDFGNGPERKEVAAIGERTATGARSDFTVAGKSHRKGSYVVDMRQPKRSVANVLLEAGRDISDKVPQMYDISGWSHRLL